MKTRLTYISLIVVCSLLFSCDFETVRVSDEVTTREVGFTDYSGLRVSNAFNAFVTFSDTEERIEVEANRNVQDRISVSKEGDLLIVRLDRNTNLRGNVTLNVYITTKNIERFEASGASNITLENALVTPDIALRLSGASGFEGEVDTERLRLRTSGASKADIFGSADHLDADLSGSSDLRDDDLVVTRLRIELSGASEAFLTVTDTIDIRASGASTLSFKGDAVIRELRLSDASEIIRR
ncbi:head GIN domain-containing protein [Flavobacteriaceae bacterium 3-367]